MIAYLDSSVLLRVVLGEPDRLAEWEQVESGVTSALAEVECLRTLDRLHRRNALKIGRYQSCREAVFDLLGRLELVDISKPILTRASSQFPTPLGTLDAIHLATAILWRDLNEPSLVLATHDRELARSARASGMTALGC